MDRSTWSVSTGQRTQVEAITHPHLGHVPFPDSGVDGLVLPLEVDTLDWRMLMYIPLQPLTIAEEDLGVHPLVGLELPCLTCGHDADHTVPTGLDIAQSRYVLTKHQHQTSAAPQHCRQHSSWRSRRLWTVRTSSFPQKAKHSPLGPLRFRSTRMTSSARVFPC